MSAAAVGAAAGANAVGQGNMTGGGGGVGIGGHTAVGVGGGNGVVSSANIVTPAVITQKSRTIPSDKVSFSRRYVIPPYMFSKYKSNKIHFYSITALHEAMTTKSKVYF